jgi:hypothetical protein
VCSETLKRGDNVHEVKLCVVKHKKDVTMYMKYSSVVKHKKEVTMYMKYSSVVKHKKEVTIGRINM